MTESTTRRPVSTSPENAVKDHIALGINYLRENNRLRARRHLLKALEIDNRSPGAHNGMALLYQVEREFELVEQHYKKALKYDKNFTQARNNYGVFLFRQQRFDDAYAQFSKVTEDTLYELRPQAFLNLGITANKLDKKTEAVDAWVKALTLNSGLSLAYLELAEYYFKEKDIQQSNNMLAYFNGLSKSTPRSLWLGIRTETILGNKDASASKGLALKKLFPNSKANLEYQKWLVNERKK